MEVLVKNVVVLPVIISLMTATLSMFLEETMQEGMILRRYRLFLLWLWIHSWRKRDRWIRKLLKPFGLCIYCYSTWIAILTYTTIMGLRLEVISMLGFNYIILKILVTLDARYNK